MSYYVYIRPDDDRKLFHNITKVEIDKPNMIPTRVQSFFWFSTDTPTRMARQDGTLYRLHKVAMLMISNCQIHRRFDQRRH